MFWFTFASLLPAVLLALACLLGGLWPLMALVSLTLVVFSADRIPCAQITPQGNGRGLSLFLAAVHFALLPFGIMTLAQGLHLDFLHKLLIFAGLGLFFGQISNSNAHELIHASARWPHRLGTALYISLLHGQHVSAHLRVHHIHVATPKDPNTARLGEGFWRYLIRAWPKEFQAGWQADTARRQTVKHGLHPYVAYLGGAALALAVSFLLAGGTGVLVHIAIASYAQIQLFLSDYVQHYGLRRAIGANGKPAPTTDAHSWNAPAWYSNAMMLNAPRHSAHHSHPARPYTALEIDADSMPMLPRSLPVMATLALVPPLWRRVMDPRAKRWQSLQTSGTMPL